MRNAFLVIAILLSVAPVAQSQTDPCSTLTFLTESLPTFQPGQPAHFDIEAIGGTGPYRFEVTLGAFPDNLHMNSSGKIRGKANEEAFTTVFVTLTDANDCTLTQAFAVMVEAF